MGWLEKIGQTGLSKDFLQNFRTQVDLEVIYFYFSNPFSIFTPKSLASALGRKKDSVEESLKNLKKAGFLKTLPQRHQLEDVYYYQPDSKNEKLIERLFTCLLNDKEKS